VTTESAVIKKWCNNFVSDAVSGSNQIRIFNVAKITGVSKVDI